jgi:competence protein ComEC
LNPGRFDLEAYLARNGVALTGSVKSALLVERVEEISWWNLRTVAPRIRGSIRRRVVDAFDRIDSSDEVPGVATALLSGDRSLMPFWAEQLYQESGTFHVMVISGAHVALLAWLLYEILRRIGLGRTP